MTVFKVHDLETTLVNGKHNKNIKIILSNIEIDTIYLHILHPPVSDEYLIIKKIIIVIRAEVIK